MSSRRLGYRYLKQTLKSFSLGKPSTPRFLTVLRHYLSLLRRIETGSLIAAGATQELITHITTFCTHEYSKVRQKAQGFFQSLHERYPTSTSRELRRLLQLLPDPHVADTVITGIVYTLNNGFALRRIATKWDLTSDLCLGLVACHRHDRTEVQTRLATLWSSFCTQARPLHAGFSVGDFDFSTDPDVTKHFSPSEIAQILDSRSAKVSKLRSDAAQSRQNLQDRMMELLGNEQLHWRYRNLVLSEFALLTNAAYTGATYSPPVAMLQFVADGLTSELLPTRRLCRQLIPSIWRHIRPQGLSPKGFHADLDATFDYDLDSCPDSDNFFDCSWLGWARLGRRSCSDPRAMVPVVAEGELHVALRAVLEQAFSKQDFVNSFIDTLASDHQLNGDEIAQMSKTSHVSMPIPSDQVTAPAAFVDFRAKRLSMMRTTSCDDSTQMA
jgi:hypothetical protein